MSFRETNDPGGFQRELPPEEKARITRIFRRRAVCTDVCLVLGAVLAVFALTSPDAPLAGPALFAVLPLLAGTLAGVFMTYGCCPFCGRRPRKWDWAWTPILWRFFRCPDCDFTPYWDKKHGGEAAMCKSRTIPCPGFRTGMSAGGGAASEHRLPPLCPVRARQRLP